MFPVGVPSLRVKRVMIAPTFGGSMDEPDPRSLAFSAFSFARVPSDAPVDARVLPFMEVINHVASMVYLDGPDLATMDIEDGWREWWENHKVEFFPPEERQLREERLRIALDMMVGNPERSRFLAVNPHLLFTVMDPFENRHERTRCCGCGVEMARMDLRVIMNTGNFVCFRCDGPAACPVSDSDAMLSSLKGTLTLGAAVDWAFSDILSMGMLRIALVNLKITTVSGGSGIRSMRDVDLEVMDPLEWNSFLHKPGVVNVVELDRGSIDGLDLLDVEAVICAGESHLRHVASVAMRSSPVPKQSPIVYLLGQKEDILCENPNPIGESAPVNPNPSFVRLCLAASCGASAVAPRGRLPNEEEVRVYWRVPSVVVTAWRGRSAHRLCCECVAVDGNEQSVEFQLNIRGSGLVGIRITGEIAEWESQTSLRFDSIEIACSWSPCSDLDAIDVKTHVMIGSNFT